MNEYLFWLRFIHQNAIALPRYWSLIRTRWVPDGFDLKTIQWRSGSLTGLWKEETHDTAQDSINKCNFLIFIVFLIFIHLFILFLDFYFIFF